MKRKKYETCIYAESVGDFAVYVNPGCPEATRVKGRLVSSKRRCEQCQRWKSKP